MPGVSPVYQSIFGAAAPTTFPNDLQEIVLGVQVVIGVTGLVVGARYYQDAADDGQHWAQLLTPSAPKVERLAVFPQAPPGGNGLASWQHVYFHKYWPVTASDTVILDVYFQKGAWWYTPGMYAGADFVSGDLVVPQHVAGTYFNGLFGYFRQIGTVGDGGGNAYGVDLLFLPRP